MDVFDKHITDVLHLSFKEEIKEHSDKKYSNEDYSDEKFDKLMDEYWVALFDYIGTGKRIEAIIGIILLIPPILGVVAFTLNLFDWGGKFAGMDHLSANWTNYGEAMSAAPIFLGLMALAGVYLLKDNIKYLLPDKNKK